MGERAIVVLAGGAATRFPGKLDALVEGQPMIARVIGRLRGPEPIYVLGSRFQGDVLATIPGVRTLADPAPGEGPLAALAAAAAAIAEPWIFVAAADQPNLDRSVLERLWEAGGPEVDAVVAKHDTTMEPLGSLYRTAAVARRGAKLIDGGHRSMHALLDALALVTVDFDAEPFANVNHPGDLAPFAQHVQA
jgi:molybdopterin-guanine dinucleotide biosynthesis protein A